MKKQLLTLTGLVVFIICTAEVTSDNGKAGYTGSPGETKCNNCHSSYALNSGGGNISMTSNMPNGKYVPGQTYTINLAVSRIGNSLFGLGCEALTSSNANAGSFTMTNNNTQLKNKTVNGVSRTNVVHTLNGGSGQNTKTFSFNWTAPQTNIGNITFYFAGIAANSDGNENSDYVYSSSQIIAPQTATGIQSVQQQNIFSISPQPANDFMNIKYNLEKAEALSISIFTLEGKLKVKLINEEVKVGIHSDRFLLNRNSLGSGTYIVQFKIDSKIYAQKLILI